MTVKGRDPATWPEVVIHRWGCRGNPGVGAWACVLQSGDRRREHSGGALATTNNRMSCPPPSSRSGFSSGRVG